jgi:hypothetical protein
MSLRSISRYISGVISAIKAMSGEQAPPLAFPGWRTGSVVRVPELVHTSPAERQLCANWYFRTCPGDGAIARPLAFRTQTAGASRGACHFEKFGGEGIRFPFLVVSSPWPWQMLEHHGGGPACPGKKSAGQSARRHAQLWFRALCHVTESATAAASPGPTAPLVMPGLAAGLFTRCVRALGVLLSSPRARLRKPHAAPQADGLLPFALARVPDRRIVRTGPKDKDFFMGLIKRPDRLAVALGKV